MRHRLLILIATLCLPLGAALAEAPVVLVLGDSLSAGYGIDTERGWVAQLAARIERAGLPHRVVNASVSGETTVGGLTRLPALLERHRPAVLVIELGANDGLRGWDFAVMRENLTRLVVQGREAGARVLLIGVRLPPNYGASYTDGFQAVFMEVAAEQGVPLVPTLLKGVAEDWSLMQADGLHPTAEAQERILDNVWPTLQPVLAD
ncbi:arylesterase [Allochromatium vinosum]|uniref:Arylesterase n=1 Tax=Allochromatium vinosum (strain ATCC 17899 / DSM 180 / NBRC 103801 / NCIMB 10441 / D) TaxID=572477 RepID=D3RSH4_ALLVD|nr:arylesterase [Allochromatium vinosum]ADC62133.1 Arylesterase [Allochromatium vinosum DSM 180]